MTLSQEDDTALERAMVESERPSGSDVASIDPRAR